MPPGSRAYPRLNSSAAPRIFVRFSIKGPGALVLMANFTIAERAVKPPKCGEQVVMHLAAVGAADCVAAYPLAEMRLRKILYTRQQLPMLKSKLLNYILLGPEYKQRAVQTAIQQLNIHGCNDFMPRAEQVQGSNGKRAGAGGGGDQRLSHGPELVYYYSTLFNQIPRLFACSDDKRSRYGARGEESVRKVEAEAVVRPRHGLGLYGQVEGSMTSREEAETLVKEQRAAVRDCVNETWLICRWATTQSWIHFAIPLATTTDSEEDPSEAIRPSLAFHWISVCKEIEETERDEDAPQRRTALESLGSMHTGNRPMIIRYSQQADCHRRRETDGDDDEVAARWIGRRLALAQNGRKLQRQENGGPYTLGKIPPRDTGPNRHPTPTPFMGSPRRTRMARAGAGGEPVREFSAPPCSTTWSSFSWRGQSHRICEDGQVDADRGKAAKALKTQAMEAGVAGDGIRVVHSLTAVRDDDEGERVLWRERGDVVVLRGAGAFKGRC
ncbi:hypothetical protein C8F01DRAFT_1084405 [Mycena amicta]|nr:hypothetical protein C8F01DRAFT_1084405 [Mycena amicta]